MNNYTIRIKTMLSFSNSVSEKNESLYAVNCLRTKSKYFSNYFSNSVSFKLECGVIPVCINRKCIIMTLKTADSFFCIRFLVS
jgi:hypothetical protein